MVTLKRGFGAFIGSRVAAASMMINPAMRTDLILRSEWNTVDTLCNLTNHCPKFVVFELLESSLLTGINLQIDQGQIFEGLLAAT
jgi:hypothetical protein